MAYKALYRSYRPNTFAEVVGQTHIIKTLRNSLKNNKTTHAYIFSGPRGIGKTTIARIFAKAINCEKPVNGEPCNKCDKCLAIINEETTDIIELDAASNNGVEEMRNLLEKVNFMPSFLNKKIYIIDEVHMLSISAFNALLKTLEEPPVHVVFILATTEPHKIPLTIHSRCQGFEFKPLTRKEIKTMLIRVIKSEEISIQEEAIDGICDAAEGGMRDALGMLDQVSVYTDDEITIEDVNNVTGRISNLNLMDLLLSLGEKDVARSLKVVDELIESGKEVSRIVHGLIQLCRDILLYQNKAVYDNKKTIFQDPTFVTLTSTLKKRQILFYLDALIDVQNKIKWSTSQMIYLEVAIMKIINRQDERVSEQTDINNEQIMNSIDAVIQFEDRMTSVEYNIKVIEELVDKQSDKKWKEFVDAKLLLLENNSISPSIPNNIEERFSEILNQQNIMEEELVKNATLLKQVKTQIDEFKHSNGEKTDYAREKDIVDDSFINRLNEIEEDFLKLQIAFEENIKPINISNSETDIDNEDIKQNRDYNLLTRLETLENNQKSFQMELEEKAIMIEIINEVLNKEKISINDASLIERIKKLEELLKAPSDVPNPDDAKPTLFSTPSESLADDLVRRVGEFELLGQSLFNRFELIEDKIKGLENAQGKKDDDQIKAEFEQLKVQSDTMTLQIAALQEALETYKALVNSELLKVSEKLNPLIEEKQSHDLDEIKKSLESLKEYSFKLGARIQQLEGMPKKEPVTIIKKEDVKQETAPIDEPIPQPKEEQSLPKPQEQLADEFDVDETAKVYDVRKIETILNNARNAKAREEKDKFIAGWRRMGEKVPYEIAHIARHLMDGTFVASGIKDIIITYPNAQMCNYLMEEKTHELAKQVLKNTFNREVDFIALPDSVWKDKRKEYLSQFSTGSQPRLKPINHPELRIIKKVTNVKVTTKHPSDAIAEDLFGKTIVKKEGSNE